MNRIKASIVTVGLVAGLSAGIAACNSPTNAPAAPKPTATAPATVAPQPVATTQAPAMTAGEQQAVTSAQGYLTDGQGFSYAGLLQQLTSQAGEGFSTADATFALHNLNPDWNAQAVIAAKGYLSDGEGFSQNSLEQQLSSPAGDGFTPAQAEYGTTQAFAAQG